MIEKKAVYSCAVCGNIVESLFNGKGTIQCCGEKMSKLAANTVDAAQEKHVPAVTREGDLVKVQVGETLHPMAPDHYILFVEVIAGNRIQLQDFVEGDTTPAAEFTVAAGTPISVRAYCNKHGLWQAEA